MSVLNKIKLTLFFNTLFAMGAVMFRFFLMIVAVIVIINVFDKGVNIKVNDKTYQFQIDTKGSK